MTRAAKILRDSSVIETKQSNDTLRLWENYREQALLWRAIALLEIPTTLTAIIFAFILWNTRSITLNVPAKPLPGTYAAQDIPDSMFIDKAANFINLIATYQPYVARRQFLKARESLVEPMLSAFLKEMVSVELQAIENTRRTQIFFADPTKATKPIRKGKNVIVCLTGERLKIIAGKELPVVTSKYCVTMTTNPRNQLNPYGIVITGVTHQKIKR